MLNTRRFFRVISSLCALVAGASSLAATVDSGPLAVAVPATSSGIIYNVVTGVTGTNDAAPPAGWDINFYSTSPTPALALFWPTTPANSHGGVAAGAAYAALETGAVVGPSRTFITTASNGFPATIRRIVYESTANTAITVPNFCGVNATIVSILDIDGDCIVDPLTDGLLLTRAMMGLAGTAVINNALGVGATRTTWEQIRLYLNQQFVANYLP